MAVIAQRLQVEVTADTAKAERDLGQMEQTGKRIPGWAKAAGAALAGAFAVDRVVAGVKAVVSAASDLEQSVGGVDAVFRDNAAQVHAWARDADQALGLSQNAYNEFATVVGSQLKNMGMPMEDVADQTNNLITMGADLAATFGGPTSDAVSALSALLRGETDPIERYGVSIKQADIQARMAAMGLDGLTGEAAKQAQAQAVLALLTEQTAAAQGKFAAESQTFAGQQQRLSAGLQDVAATLGGVLLPAGTGALSWANDMVGAFGGWLPGALETARGALSGIGDSLRGFIGPASGAFQGLIAAISPLIPQVLQAVQAMNPLSLIFQALAPVLPQIGAMLGQLAMVLGNTLGTVLQTVVPLLAQVAQIIVGALSQAFMSLMPTVTSLVPLIGQLVSIVGGALGEVLQAVAPLIVMLAEAVAEVIPVVADLIPPVLDVVKALLPLVSVVADLIGALLPPLVDLFTALLKPILAVISPLVGALAPILSSIAQIIGTALVPMITTLASWLGNLLSAVMPVITAIAGGLVSAISGLIQWVASAASGIASFVAGAVSGIASFVSSVSAGIGNAVQWFRDLPGKLLNAIRRAPQMMLQAGRNILQGLIDGIKSMVSKVTGAIGGVMKAVRNFLPFSPAKEGPFSGRGWSFYSGESIPEDFARGIMRQEADVRRAGRRLAEAANIGLGTVTPAAVGLPTQRTRATAQAAQAASPGAAALPSTLVLVDRDGTFIARMQVEAGKVATGKVTPLDHGKVDWS